MLPKLTQTELTPSSLSGCYFSKISCAFHFGKMFNGFLTSAFDFYWSLALQFQGKNFTEGTFLFTDTSDYFQWKMNVFYVDQSAHLLVCLVQGFPYWGDGTPTSWKFAPSPST